MLGSAGVAVPRIVVGRSETEERRTSVSLQYPPPLASSVVLVVEGVQDCLGWRLHAALPEAQEHWNARIFRRPQWGAAP